MGHVVGMVVYDLIMSPMKLCLIMSTGDLLIVNIVQYGQYLLILMCPGHNLPI